MRFLLIALFIAGCGSPQAPPPAKPTPAQDHSTVVDPKSGESESDAPAEERTPEGEIDLGLEGDYESVEVEEVDSGKDEVEKKGSPCTDDNECMTLCMLGCGTFACVDGHCQQID